ncbi:MAG: efflux RND transporter periplasmic adaptor subunit [Peptococcaceae bacterium]|nr:efflux RND transporter periplasmic adaptor subunit [Peptococcaceae bacterium]
MRGRLFFTGLLLLLLSVFVSGCVSGKETLKTSGTVEANEVRVVAEVGGTLAQVLVSEGDVVEKGQEIARLAVTEMETQVAQAVAGLDKARAKLAEVKAGSRTQEIAAAQQEVKGLEAEVEAARTDFNLQQDTLEKYRQLAGQGAVTEYELQIQENKAAKAQHRLETAKARLKAAQSRLDLLRAGARSETIKQLEAQVDAAEAVVRLAELNLSKTVLRAPASGTVMTCNFKEGEVIKPGAEVVTLADTSHLYLYTYVPENRLSEVKLGQQVEVMVDSYPNKRFKGQVTFIAPKAEFTPKNVQTEEDRVRLVFKVKVEIKDGQDKLWPGMPADVYFK